MPQANQHTKYYMKHGTIMPVTVLDEIKESGTGIIRFMRVCDDWRSIEGSGDRFHISNYLDRLMP